MPVAAIDAAQFTLGQLKERGDRVMAKVREALETHLILLRETRELHAEIHSQHHPPAPVHT